MVVLQKETHESLVVLDSRDRQVLVLVRSTFETLIVRDAGNSHRFLTSGRELDVGDRRPVGLRGGTVCSLPGPDGRIS